jgi:hypothetical protein
MANILLLLLLHSNDERPDLSLLWQSNNGLIDISKTRYNNSFLNKNNNSTDLRTKHRSQHECST